MARHIDHTPQAAADISALAEYLRMEAGLAVALRFVAKAEAAFGALADTPHAGASLGFAGPGEQTVRRWHIDGFPNHLILYRPTAQGIEIIRVLHAARDIASLFRDDPP